MLRILSTSETLHLEDIFRLLFEAYVAGKQGHPYLVHHNSSFHIPPGEIKIYVFFFPTIDCMTRCFLKRLLEKMNQRKKKNYNSSLYIVQLPGQVGSCNFRVDANEGM